jgi:hypothetical protein
MYTSYVPNFFKVTYCVPEPVTRTEANCKLGDYGLKYVSKVNSYLKFNWLNNAGLFLYVGLENKN